MTITEKSFILVEELTGTLIVDDQLEKLLREEMRPVLWFRKGLSCVVPVEILKNLLIQRNIHMLKYITDGYKKKPELKIDWKQAWPAVDCRPLYALSGLEY